MPQGQMKQTTRKKHDTKSEENTCHKDREKYVPQRQGSLLKYEKKYIGCESMNNLTTGLIPMTNSMVQKAVNLCALCIEDQM